nr:MAG TPA: hypothetical protein [Caudoviricetes sp.]
MGNGQHKVSILKRIGLAMLLVVVAISFTFDSIWNRFISFFKRK